MQNLRKHHWLISGAIALSVAAATPALVRAQRERERGREEYDRSIELKEAPRAVLRTIDEHRRENKISELDHIRRGDFEFYRAVVRIGEHTVRDIRVAPDGRLLGEEDYKDNENWRDRERAHDRDRR